MQYFRGSKSGHAWSLTFTAVAFASGGCSGEVAEGDGASTQDPIIFGTDNRIEFGGMSDAAWVRHAQGTAALFRSASLACGGGVCALDTQPFTWVDTGSQFDPIELCSGAPYKGQEQGAFCTAFLIAPDTFATAGHCFCGSNSSLCGTPFGQTRCATTRVVFGFHADADGSNEVVSVPATDVYSCTEVTGTWKDPPSLEDWAIFKVDRPVAGRAPLVVRNTGTPNAGGSLLLVGHPDGLPMKLAAGGQAKGDPSSHLINWGSSVDAFAGNSGSPVVHLASGLVEGIHIRRPVQHYFQQNGCALPRVCSETTGCPPPFFDSPWAQHTNFGHVAGNVVLPLHAALVTAL
jgi:hypothetical protein